MKLVIFLFLCMLSVKVVGQITYEPIFVEQCTGSKVYHHPLWYLKDSHDVYGLDLFDSEYVILPAPGTYWMHFEFDEQPPIEIVVPKTRSFKDTIRLPRLELVHYISNPPHSEFLDCGELAQGKVIDYYNNGNVRMKGTFEDGQTVDTLFTYHQNGNLLELFVPFKKGWKRTKYFENGNIKSYYNVVERVYQEYFISGEIRLNEQWNTKYQRSIKEYNEDGVLILDQTKRRQKQFFDTGQRKSEITRKEVLILERIFLKRRKPWDRFYEFNWKVLDSNEVIQRTFYFFGSSFEGQSYPSDYTQIHDFLLQEIIFYENGAPHQKIHFRTKKEQGEYVRYTVLSRMINGHWSEGTETNMNDETLYQLIKNLSDKQEKKDEVRTNY